MEKHPAVVWSLRLLAALAIGAFFIEMYAVKFKLGVVVDIDVLSLNKIALGEGEAMKQLAKLSNDRSKMYPALYLYLLPFVAGIVFSFIGKLKPYAKYVYAVGFLVSLVIIFTLFAALVGRIDNVGVLPNGWYHVAYFVALAGFVLSMASILRYAMEKLRE